MFKYLCLSFSKSISNSKLMYNVLHYITISAFSIAAFWYSFYPEKQLPSLMQQNFFLEILVLISKPS